MSISTDLLAYYRCADADDEQGNHNVTLSDISITANGKYGDGWSLDNSSISKADLSTTIDFTQAEIQTSGYTISAWVKGQGVISGGQTTVLTSETNGVMPLSFKTTGIHFRLGFETSGFYQSTLPGGGDAEGDLNNLAAGGSYWRNTDFSATTWYHWTLTVLNGTAKYFLNGVHVATVSASQTNNAANFIRIGNLTNGWFGKKALADVVDEVAVWGRVLSNSEITEVYGNEIHTLIDTGTVILLPQGTNSQSLFTQGYALQAS